MLELAAADDCRCTITPCSVCPSPPLKATLNKSTADSPKAILSDETTNLLRLKCHVSSHTPRPSVNSTFMRLLRALAKK